MVSVACVSFLPNRPHIDGAFKQLPHNALAVPLSFIRSLHVGHWFNPSVAPHELQSAGSFVGMAVQLQESVRDYCDRLPTVQ